MNKIKLFILFFLSLSFCSASFGAGKQQAQSAKSNINPNQIGWALAMYDVILARDNSVWTNYKTKETKSFAPADGATKYGFTYYKDYKDLNKWADGRPTSNGWCKVVAQGQTPYWRDTNHNGKIDNEEIKQVPYMVWYTATCNSDINLENELPDSSGVYPNVRKSLEEEAAKYNIPKRSGIGDLAYEGAYGYDQGGNHYDQGEKLIAVRGLFWLRYQELKICMQVGDKYIGGTAEYDLKWLIDNGGDKTSKWLAGSDLVQQYRALRAEMGDTLIKLGKDVMKEWDKWYLVPVAAGPDFKGLYLNSAEYLPQPEEISTEIVLRNKNENPYSSSINYDYKGGKDIGVYSATIESKGIDCNATKADQPMSDAHDEFLDKQKQAKSYFKDLKEISLPGADEAFQANMEYPGTALLEKIVFRKANVVAEVISSESLFMMKDKKKKPLKPTMKIAQKIIEKMIEAGKRRNTGEKPKETKITLTAKPQDLWSDGKSVSKLALEAIGAAGEPIANTKFTITVENGFVGDCVQSDVVTDAQGKAEIDYKAGTRPGANTVTARSEEGKGELTMRHGGMTIEPEDPNQLQVYTDGESKMPLVVKCVDFEGKPLAKVKLNIALEKKGDFPQAGTIEPEVLETGADGIGKIVYTAPLVDVSEGFNGGMVYVNVEASMGTPARAIRDYYRINLSTGQTYTMEVEKKGYQKLENVKVNSACRNGVVSGVLITKVGEEGKESTEDVGVAAAKISIFDMVDGKRKIIGSGETDEEGKFKVEFVGEKVTAGKSSEVELKDPLEFKMDKDIEGWIARGIGEREKLRAKKYICLSVIAFYQRYPYMLARSKPFCQDRSQDTGYLVNAPALMSLLCGYMNQLDNAHTESVNWFMESMQAAVDDLFKLTQVSDKIKTVLEKTGGGLADMYKTDPSLAGLRDKVESKLKGVQDKWWYQFISKIYTVMRDAYKAASDYLDNREKFGLSNDEGMAAYVKYFKDKADSYNAKWAFDPLTAAGENGEKWFKDAVNDYIKDLVVGGYSGFFAKEYEIGARRILKAEATWSDFSKPMGLCREMYADFQAAHTQLNMDHLDRELYRLDLKLGVDTIVKGVVIYQNAKDMVLYAKDLSIEKFKKGLTECIDTVDTAYAGVDGVLRSYQGMKWITDIWRARDYISRVVDVVTE